MEQFDDIRPYHDHEVRPTLDRLLHDKDLLKVLAHHRYPGITRCFPRLMCWLTARIVQRKTRHITDIRSFQGIIEPYLTRVIRTTTSKVTYSGLEHLDSKKAHLFLSNHRDIVLDPALVNYALFQDHRETCRIAIGDNLVKRSFVSDLMRLNKSFLVKRSVIGRREKLKAFQDLSGYIHHCIQTNHPVWIAQSEGRAKDGNDKTDTAIIKMFNVSRRGKDESFADSVKALHIVPVSISYEFDPCDAHKARELHETEMNGLYNKAEDEDMMSIVKGIEGYKGHVHVAFGKPLTDSYDNAEAVVREVNHQIWSNYKLQPANLFAWEAIDKKTFNVESGVSAPDIKELFPDVDIDAKREEFSRHLERCEPEHRDWLLKMYAYPVVNHYRVHP
ncbi:hypothetical protein ACH42_12570 [Endozoicomonas sp. (ex Bugula neritina AB1)]|nr:hypothetical protein ACH42_12570 [Endozoicomonas sp. (ex Bugula neritina AB1)]